MTLKNSVDQKIKFVSGHGLSEDLETGYPKLAIVKIFGFLFFILRNSLQTFLVVVKGYLFYKASASK